MRYEFIAIEPSGNGSDLILKVRREPHWWEALAGSDAPEESFFGPHPFWVTMDGRPVTERVEHALDRVWHEHRREAHAQGERAWRLIEPPVANDHHRLAARATFAR